MQTSTKTNSKAWFKTLRYDLNGCRVCDNTPNHDGYIRVSGFPVSKKGLIMLHVLQWELVNGKKPEGMEINHTCGNRACCNIEHLELIDGSSHATLTNVNRVGYSMKRHTDKDIAEIYRRVKYENESINSLCLEFNIKRSTVSSIINKRSRCAITDEVDRDFNREE